MMAVGGAADVGTALVVCRETARDLLSLVKGVPRRRDAALLRFEAGGVPTRSDGDSGGGQVLAAQVGRGLALRVLITSLERRFSMSTSHDLTVRFLGVRGSIPVTGPDAQAGGNTACLEVCAGDTRIILDAGSGLRILGNERMLHGPRHSTILLSHLHWDHICGLPFFTPIYVPGHRVEIASGPNGVME